MALTEIPSELSSTPSIVDGGNATAIKIDGSENVLVNTANAGASGLSLSNGSNLSFAEGANSSIANLFRQTSSAASFLGSGYRFSATANKAESSYASSWARTAIGVGYGAIKFYADAAATVAVGTDITPTERVRITPNGITFNGDTAAANAISDYEEGTWTPVIKAVGTGGNNATYTLHGPTYTKVGRLVNVQVYISGINISAITGGTYITLQGFPFACTNYADFTIAYKSGDWSTSGNIIGGYMQSGVSYAYFMRANGLEALQTSTDITMTRAMINITYQAS
jgi:hypothetical protein